MNEVGITSRVATFTGITFTVNTAANDVPLVLAGTPDLLIDGVNGHFLQGENFIIEGFCLSLPYQFGQGEINNGGAGQPGYFMLGWRDTIGNNGSLNQVGILGRINISDANYWYETYTFVRQPILVAGNYFMEITGLSYNVSMFNCPATLNEEVLNAAIHVKVRTTYSLT